MLPFLILGAGLLALVFFLPRRAIGYVDGKPVELELGSIGGGLYLRKDIAVFYNRMRDHARREGIALTPSGPRSAFRTTEQQQSLTVDRAEFAAPVNKSPHQAGIAVDIDVLHDVTGNPKPEYYWLRENGPMYGFYQTLQNEPWHWQWKPGVAVSMGPITITSGGT